MPASMPNTHPTSRVFSEGPRPAILAPLAVDSPGDAPLEAAGFAGCLPGTALAAPAGRTVAVANPALSRHGILSRHGTLSRRGTVRRSGSLSGVKLPVDLKLPVDVEVSVDSKPSEAVELATRSVPSSAHSLASPAAPPPVSWGTE